MGLEMRVNIAISKEEIDRLTDGLYQLQRKKMHKYLFRFLFEEMIRHPYIFS